ncbi:hypothetical protein [Streptococcus pluranimalium]|uniref:hypothetical protein n=1 Tax=Streptococcus pluranimalium TaxID=82348 RepID=UPI003F690C78
MKIMIDVDLIKWLLKNETSYAISKACGLSTQAIDKYKKGISDIYNMKLINAIKMTEFAKEKKENKDK